MGGIPVTHNKIQEEIKSFINNMPSLPVSARKVLEICNNANVNPVDLGKVISLDPVLTGRLLQLINSSFYSFNSHITSIVKAITMLGINTVKNLTLSAAILGTLPKNKVVNGLNMEGYWHHSLCVGITSKLLAAKQGVDTRFHQEYFTAGLLHDIGKIPLNAISPEEYIHTIEIADNEHKSLFIAENENLGINHCITGGMIAAAWKFDSPVSDVISFHHSMGDYNSEYLHVIYNVAAADYFTTVYDIGFAGNMNPQKPDDSIWKIIGLTEDSFEELKDKVYREIEKAKIFLHL
jgi:putative nucleotidyltransferase with HDIG domain